MPKEYTPEERLQWIKGLHGIAGSAAMILESPSSELLIVKANYKKHWTLPGGVIDEGESPKQAAIREVMEETNVTVSPEVVEFAGVVYRHNSEIGLYQFIFKAPISLAMIESITPRESEIDECLLVTKEQVKSGDLPCSLRIVEWANEDVPGYAEQALDLSVS